MKAAVLVQPNQPLVIEELSISKPGPHEVLIRTAACGLCPSDPPSSEAAYSHPLPAIPSQETAGIVEVMAIQVATRKPCLAVISCK